MSDWYNASAGVVSAANSAMAETVNNEDAQVRIREIWEPIALALRASEPDFDNWPELAKQADDLGPDYVGVTSDTRKLVCWGGDNGKFRPFVIIE
jgi:hypothetical protein